MKALCTTIVLGFWTGGCADLAAGPIVLPSDVSVALTADPSVDLKSGQRIEFTISVTNHGPEPVMPVIMQSSPIYDELDVFTATGDCGNTLGLAVVDLNDGYYYAYSWFPTIDILPLEVGETRYCHLNLDFTEWAPDTFSLTFSMPSWLVDLDGSNNSATVTLRRAAAAATAVPMLSPLSLLLLAGLLVTCAGLRRCLATPCHTQVTPPKSPARGRSSGFRRRWT